MRRKQQLQKQEDVRSLHPRSQVVPSKNRYNPNFNVDITTPLWPAPKVEKHGTG